MLRQFSIAGRLMSLLAIVAIFALGVGGAYTYYLNKVGSASLDEAETIMQRGYERTLKFAVQSMATDLGGVVERAQSEGRDELTAIREAIKPVRFGEKGYYFLYDTSGTNVAHPLRPDFHGKNRIGNKDKKGNAYIKALVEKAKAGGGFVTYWFNKPGEEEPSPKLAYAQLVPGTDYWVATGIYTDDIKAERARIEGRLTEISGTALRNVSIGGGVVLVLIVLPVCLLISRSIITPVRTVTEEARKVAAGDFSVRIQNEGRDEITQLEEALGVMLDTLRGNIEEIEKASREASDQADAANAALKEAEEAKRQAENARREGMMQAAERLEGTVERVRETSGRIAGYSQEIRNGSETQSERVHSTATAMEEMNATVLEVARNSSEAADVGRNANEQAVEGARIVEQSIEAMQATQGKTEDLKRNMDVLGQRAEDIGAIINVIEDIADQTNLLALNAAIEAARAGEAGRGFAVVADEVRKLAEKTMQATREVSDSIMSIQDVARTNVASVDAAVADLGQAVGYTEQSGEVLRVIVKSVQTSADQISGIATAAEQQSATSEEINQAVEEINAITGRTAEDVQRTVEELGQLNEEIESLNQLVRQLKSG
ncbi:methyl-accepting chemotaxis protein [Salidesulfovibrio brasiliensis]|uniref:methyl-accepting chemotaxis protein n=1 Tax=Salidesulfovibrio brasiliensis TaxID=221711 RepID=UPI000B174C4B|nr:methyl-accepting chemotaxis protein [Salidesulfovibrio brasiliensis]